ncbi:MAG: glycosyltransferase family 87 protein, partial [Corynebacterium sp.]|nr:glycosyltransferase family 87 protein [Corynebacterium sp.]
TIAPLLLTSYLSTQSWPILQFFSGEPSVDVVDLFKRSTIRDRILLLAPVLVCLICLFYSLEWLIAYLRFGHPIDMGIFQLAGKQMREHKSLYTDFLSETGVDLAFIYPPFAAIIFIPLSFLSRTVGKVVWTLLTVLALWAVLFMVGRRLAPKQKPYWTALLSILFMGPTMLMEPIAAGIHYAQIDVFLLFLVALDVLGFMPKKLRGVGIGLAAGIKITPACYAVILLGRKDWYGIITSAITFLITAIIGFIVTPSESKLF